ncbi:MAG TPA: extracellular solute-binding protein [Sedimentisphaerales bacterium]|nr:extracellular solute-binding protein [Sedimentisphaerales bacterium]
MKGKYGTATAALTLFGAIGLMTGIGCGKRSEPGKPEELVVLCGISFVKPTEELCRQFTEETGIKVATTVAGSEDFLPLVQAGKEGDILITHDPYLDYVRDANALADSVQVGFVAPVLAVQKGNPKRLKSIDDLARAGLKVGMTDPKYSTCGEMVFALLEKKGIKEAVLKNVDTRLTKGHSTMGTWLETQVVDAVIMWNGVAKTFKDSLEVVRTPYEYDKEIRVHIIGLSHTKQPDALKRFIGFARENGPALFAEHGYVK